MARSRGTGRILILGGIGVFRDKNIIMIFTDKDNIMSFSKQSILPVALGFDGIASLEMPTFQTWYSVSWGGGGGERDGERDGGYKPTIDVCDGGPVGILRPFFRRFLRTCLSKWPPPRFGAGRAWRGEPSVLPFSGLEF